jgi:NTP pyrophosphatase (non-canonical NTP hydrolase)
MIEIEDKIKETLVITQEECAEVIQSVSKILRFGFDSSYPFEDSATTRECLEMEVGQLLCMVDILVEQGVLDATNVRQARSYKREKLKEWSSIFDATN